MEGAREGVRFVTTDRNIPMWRNPSGAAPAPLCRRSCCIVAPVLRLDGPRNRKSVDQYVREPYLDLRRKWFLPKARRVVRHSVNVFPSRCARSFLGRARDDAPSAARRPAAVRCPRLGIGGESSRRRPSLLATGLNCRISDCQHTINAVVTSPFSET
jgi:hypothetical protein